MYVKWASYKYLQLQISVTLCFGKIGTRLGEFLPNVEIFTLVSFLKITEVAETFRLLSRRQKLCINFDENWSGHLFGRFSLKLIRSPWKWMCLPGVDTPVLRLNVQYVERQNVDKNTENAKFIWTLLTAFHRVAPSLVRSGVGQHILR
jgi:hypothetical protein